MADKKKSSWQTVEEYQTEKLNKRTADAIKESKKITKEKKDSYTERNEFKPGFYDQPSKPPITPETYYGTASGKTSFESPIVDPDTSMMMNRNEGGEVSKYVSDLIGPTIVTPRVEGGTRQESGAIIKDKGVGINIESKLGNFDISKKEEKITSPRGDLKIDSTTGAYEKKFESGVGIRGSVTKRSPEGGRNETDKRATLSYQSTFNKGGSVEIGKGKDYIKDLL